ncbi:MAG TPA: CopD family protein [Stellaceae bacterium]|nr:CopD family protein [Stellaceae bacterium]
MFLPSLALVLHELSAIVWVGGMFFALLVLRPATGPLDPAARLALWRRVLGGFFAWVFAAVALLLISGFTLFLGGYAGGLHVHVMMAIGIIMMLIFFHVYFAPWKRFRRALDRGDSAAAAVQLDQIRILVMINLVLGLVTAAIGASGRFWG